MPPRRWNWAQLGLHARPCGLVNLAGFFDPFLAQTARAVADGLIRPEHRDLVLDDPTVGGSLERMRRFHPIALPKWAAREVR